ncbi:hypothetical protein GCM10025862_07490 [Arsenicicoccus piscis]|uniref:Uncharacterized protein n=1 Tax=Arsenicicoccus piscis TaxID=673954 RepID=A0ABQ6HM32_9MICO|nr:hypothetical protein GCM10025862_07490 [Arsenicicoccus piscis]
MNTTVLDPATRGRAPARAPAPGRKVPDEPRNRSEAAIGGSTVPFRIATAVSLLCVPVVLALATRAEPSTLVANNLYLGAVLVLLLLTLFMPNRVLLVLRTGMAETPEALLTAPLLLIGPRWGYIAAVAFLCGVVSLRMGTKRIDVLFNIAQGALSAAAALLVYLAVLGPSTSEVTMRTALAALLAVFVQDGVSEVLTDLGVWLDGMNASLPSLNEIWWRAYATVCGGCVAIGAAALAITRPELTVVAVILMTVSVGHQTALTLESNQRWLAEALYEASERIRSATTADEVRPILTSALDRLWRRKDWRYSATVVPESRGSIVFPSAPAPSCCRGSPVVSPAPSCSRRPPRSPGSPTRPSGLSASSASWSCARRATSSPGSATASDSGTTSTRASPARPPGCPSASCPST